MNKYNFDVSPY